MPTQQPSRGIDRTKFEAAVNSTTHGRGNTPLHLAASEGKIACIKEHLRFNPLLVKATNTQGNTALHLAAQRGCSEVVKVLLQEEENAVDAQNKLGETALFKAYESGDLDTVKVLFEAHPASLRQRTLSGRTCLYVAIIKGNTDLVKHVLDSPDAEELIEVKYEYDDTALHVATAKNYLHIMSQLIEFQPELCYCVNRNEETPLCMAVKLGHLKAVEELIKSCPEAVEIPDSCGMNVLHLAAQVNQVRIADYLNQKVALSYLINEGLEKPPEEESLRTGVKKDPSSRISEGDTSLHIAARNKNIRMVESLLRIQGINKDAINKEGLTALDIATENTEYHECHNMIAMLANYPHKGRHFLHSFPNVGQQKYESAIKLVNDSYKDRSSKEVVVAVLLATMSFTAVFTIPGGFQTDVGNGETQKMLGSPLLIGSVSFKAFLIFDCLAFFLSLLALLMWQISTPLTTGNKVMFLYVTNILVCSSFGLTALAFVATVYTMLMHKINTLAFFVLGFCTIICGCGFVLLSYGNIKFIVKMARFNHLHGVIAIVADRLVEYLWTKLELLGCLTGCARVKAKYTNCNRKGSAKLNNGCVENV